MKTILLSLFIIGWISSSTYAQEKRILKGKMMSATSITDKQEEFLKSHAEALQKFERPKSMGLIEVPIKVHIVRDSKDSDPLDIQEIHEAVSFLNKFFVNIYIRFVVLGDFNYIRSDRYYKLDIEKENQLCSGNDVENIINLYIVGEIDGGPNKFCGYTYYPEDLEKNTDRIFISKECINDQVSLIRQMGHYFTLFPTAGLHHSETKEFVNGSNCKEEGDLLCDTPADPGLTVGTVDDRCGYIGRKQDQSGRRRFYKPDTHNMMSDNPRLYCCNRFTEMQYHKMLYAAFNLRNYLTFPKSEYSRKQLRVLAEEKGIEGEVEIYVQGEAMNFKREGNTYINEEYNYPSSTPYRMKITNYKKGYLYVLEGDQERGLSLLYPHKGDKVYFKDSDGKVDFVVPTGDRVLKVDELKGEDGRNHIVVLFSRKQLRIQDLIEEMNELDESLDAIQRLYTVIGPDLIPAQNLTYGKTGTKVTGIAFDQQIMPVIVEYSQQ